MVPYPWFICLLVRSRASVYSERRVTGRGNFQFVRFEDVGTAEDSGRMLRLTDLREILRYVPRFREKIFVIAVDGAVVDHENFANLLLDIALLRSLRIGVALVHGASHQIRRLAAQTGHTPSNTDGTGVTDSATFQLALTAATRVTHTILQGLAATDLRGAYGNALVAHPAGILHGVDYQRTG